jgi:membrane protease YdiL (CAAX protease family)
MAETRSPSPILVFLLFVLLFCGIPALAIIASGSLQSAEGTYIFAMMWGSAIAALVTVRVLKLDPGSLGFGWRDTGAAWTAYLVPILYALIAYGFVWITGIGGFAEPETVQKIARHMGWAFTDRTLVVALFALLIGTTGMLSNTAWALGEELGWRGFLVPHLVDKYGYTGGTWVMCLIWFVWHTPLILFSNYNNGTPPTYNLACFAALIVAASFIATWLRLKSGSVWPAAILHGSHNLWIQTIFTPLTASHGVKTAYAIDEFGFAVPAVGLAFALYFWLRRDVALAAYAERRRNNIPS